MCVRAVAQLGGRWPFDREVQDSNPTMGNGTERWSKSRWCELIEQSSY